MNALIADIRQQKQTIEFKDGAFFNGIDDMSIRVGHQDRETGLLNDVLIYDTRNQSKNGTMSTTIADSGYIRLSDDKKYLLVTLYKGERYETRRDYQWYNESQFTQQTFDMQNAVIPLEGFDFERSSSDRFSHGTQTQSIARLEKDIDSLNIVVAREMARSYEPLLRNNLLQYDPVVMGMMDSVKTDYSYRRPEPVYERLDYMTLVQRKDILNNALMKAKNSRNAINYEEDSYKQNLNNLYRSEIEWHRKVSLPVSVMIFFLIGAPLGAIIRKGGLGMPVVVSVLFFVVYYIISMSGEKMARDGISTAFQGMWLSSFILLPIALYLIYKSTNDSNLFNMDWYRIQYAKLKEWVGRKRQHRKESKSMEQRKLNTVEEVLEDFRQGKVVIVVDDEDRENEGDFIVAAEKITPEIVNFMLHNGRGVLCAPLTEDRCRELDLDMMVGNNTSLLGTPFTVTVDYLHDGCTTGVSIHDRAATIRALVDPNAKPEDFGRPGHINPLRARNKGVLRRPGHTEATIDLARMAGMRPGGALIEIMNEDGTMARLPQLLEIADRFGLKIVSIADIIAYRLRTESIVERAKRWPCLPSGASSVSSPSNRKAMVWSTWLLSKEHGSRANRSSSAFTRRVQRAIFSGPSGATAVHSSKSLSV